MAYLDSQETVEVYGWKSRILFQAEMIMLTIFLINIVPYLMDGNVSFSLKMDNFICWVIPNLER